MLLFLKYTQYFLGSTALASYFFYFLFFRTPKPSHRQPTSLIARYPPTPCTTSPSSSSDENQSDLAALKETPKTSHAVNQRQTAFSPEDYFSADEDVFATIDLPSARAGDASCTIPKTSTPPPTAKSPPCR